MVNQYPPFVGSCSASSTAGQKWGFRMAMARKKKTMVGIVCTFIFFHSSPTKLPRFHIWEALYARNPLTKKNSGMRNSTRKGIHDEPFHVSPNPIPATWLATTKIIVKPRKASSHSSRGFFTTLFSILRAKLRRNLLSSKYSSYFCTCYGKDIERENGPGTAVECC